MSTQTEFEKALSGKTLMKIVEKNDELIFVTTHGEVYRLFHDQDCCEQVTIEDICGDLDDLIGYPLLEVEEATNEDTNPPDVSSQIIAYQDCFKWTFYKMRTINGGVVIRWYGDSNGYYSVAVDFERLPNITANEYYSIAVDFDRLPKIMEESEND